MIRYSISKGLLPKLGTNALKLIELRKENPCLPTSVLSRKLGLSRERGRQILKQAGLLTTTVKYHRSHYCKYCGKLITLVKSGKKGSYYPKFCPGSDHRVKYNQDHSSKVEIECANCGKHTLKLQASVLKSGVDFCSNKCK